MNNLFMIVLFANGVIAGYFALQRLWNHPRKDFLNYMTPLLCVASCLWSLGYAAMLYLGNVPAAYFYRSVGLFGIFSYIFVAQLMVCRIARLPKNVRYLLSGLSSTGFVIFFILIQEDQYSHSIAGIGTGVTSFFQDGLVNHLFTTYCLLATTIITVLSIYIRFRPIKRLQTIGKYFILIMSFFIFGIFLDSFFPIKGDSAVPILCIFQFWGMCTIYHAVYLHNKSQITVVNMADYMLFSVSSPIFVFDTDRKLCLANAASTPYLHPDTEPNRESLGKLNRAETIFQCSADEIFDFEGESKNFDTASVVHGGSCSLSINKINDKHGDVIGYIVVTTDLSERIKTLHHLEQAMEEAEAANISKSTFLAKMSHEIRTPMNSIIGFSELLLKKDLEPETKTYAEDISTSAKSLLSIINDILDISKLESGKAEVVNVEYYSDRLLSDIYLIIDTLAKKKGLDFSITLDPDVPLKLLGDKVRIRSILINLLNNAVKYTKRGKVGMHIGILERTGDKIKFEVKVSDTGIGIRKEDIGKLFENFSQLDRKNNSEIEGTGLGLSIVKGYLELMGGTIDVESVYGLGSVFTVVCEQKVLDETPLNRTEITAQNDSGQSSISDLKFCDTNVLVVDDSRLNLKVAYHTFAQYGLTVDTAASGEDAIALCKKNLYDIVFMDQMMPEMDGIEAMKTIRTISSHYAKGGHCKHIVLTANAIMGTRDLLIAEGFDDYLGKPINYKLLEIILSKYIPEEKKISG
ncbi:MAG: response regulator [Lachnospiraceae bacterium]|nr:response regulator [Lachnospiraceae bacterium]